VRRARDQGQRALGDPGARQKEIGATVSRFPCLDERRNEDVDVSEIACFLKK
jgi:hypothetical protein